MNILRFVNYFIALLMICNPFAVLPLFLKLTAADTFEERRRTSLIATFAVACILVGATWLGMPVLLILGIKLAPFRFAGALVVLMLAFSMLRAEDTRLKQTSEEKVEAITKSSIAITPLAIPLIAGPGAISAIIVEASQYTGLINHGILSFVAIAVALFMGTILYFATKVENILGRVGLNIFTRIGGLVVASNALDSLSVALKEMFPGLTG
ncbi:MAG: amino acid transporter [Chlamydiae bacterium CG10_big_fil_rev_8_21_14_0_10_35_9]|nr:MAG: amino acid transporter [Chlamydiae bacterium CG10_big_fil_rev_8_21_14_0_10_35_9]